MNVSRESTGSNLFYESLSPSLQGMLLLWDTNDSICMYNGSRAALNVPVICVLQCINKLLLCLSACSFIISNLI